MGKSDPQTGRGQSGRTADESSGAERQVEGGEAPLSEDEKWGFTDKKGGMPSETKAGVAIVLVLVCAFGFIAWNKYGTSLKPNGNLANNGDANGENPAAETLPPAQPGDIPSAFTADDSQVRVAANEEEIFGNQLEPAPAPAQAAPAGDLWEPQPTTTAMTPAPAQAAPVDPDAFGGFDDTAMEPAAVTPAADPAVMAQGNQYQANAFDASADPFGDPAPAQAQQPVQAAPAAPATAQFDDNAWGSTEAPAAAAPVATEPEPFDPGFGADPIDNPQAQPARVTVDAGATDLFGDNFDPAPPVQQQPVQQPAPVADAGFGDDAFGGGFDPEPMPAAVLREPAPIAQPAPDPVSVVSQPEPVQKTDPFEATDARVDFNDVPVRRDNFQPKPVQRYDRGTTRTTERFVGEQPPARQTTRTASYTVKASDTYWGISKKVYGTSKYYRALAKYNENVIPDPRRMRPGTQLAVPTIAVLERSYPKLFPRVRNASVRTTVDTRKPAGLYVDANDRPVYRVGSSDSLSQIAERHLGTSNRWKQIYELNRKQLASPTSIRPGMLLAMPMDASQVSYR